LNASDNGARQQTVEKYRAVIPEHLEQAINSRYRRRVIAAFLIASVLGFAAWVLVEATFGHGSGAAAAGLIFFSILYGLRHRAADRRLGELLRFLERAPDHDRRSE